MSEKSSKSVELLGGYPATKSTNIRASWSTKTVVKIVALSTVVQLCIYLAISRYMQEPVSDSCHMTTQGSPIPAATILVPATHAGLVKYEVAAKKTTSTKAATTLKASPTNKQTTSSIKVTTTTTAATSASATTTSLLNIFQVYQPVFAPDASELDCGAPILLMNHTFAYSYGLPFVGSYTPPNCKFNRVTINFTVESRGRQFDRLALMYFGDTEVWRTSTAEPTAGGIIFTYIKDMTEYLYFWNSPQTIIFDLGNVVDSTYTGLWNTTLTATFFTAQDTVDEPASLIIPISARLGAEGAASIFMVPSANASNTVNFPRNANRAVFSISACGQATEEFWWGNVLQSNIDTFNPYLGTLYGYSPFREVQVLIDGQLAGVQWPFPVIFTGGVVPGLWRPIVGIDAYDLKEHEIDITPFLPILSNGAEHTFEIRVAGILEDGKGSGSLTRTVGASWYVTGKIFLWQDSADSITTGKPPTISLPAPKIVTTSIVTQDASGANETLEYTTNVKRKLTISSTVKTQKGSHHQTWTQNLDYDNYGLYTDYGAVQLTIQSTNGTDQTTGLTAYKTTYSYPAYTNTTYLANADGTFTLDADVNLGKDLAVSGHSVFPSGLQPFANIPGAASLVSGLSGSYLTTRQNGTAHYAATTGGSTGFGSTSQVFKFVGIDVNGDTIDGELYSRDVAGVNLTVVKDVEVLIGVEIKNFFFPVEKVSKAPIVMGKFTPKEIIGKGPGVVKQVLVQTG